MGVWYLVGMFGLVTIRFNDMGRVFSGAVSEPDGSLAGHINLPWGIKPPGLFVARDGHGDIR
jgi:hypothetical protein